MLECLNVAPILFFLIMAPLFVLSLASYCGCNSYTNISSFNVFNVDF